MSGGPIKKRHHYVPVTYLKSFTGSDGMIRICRKDEPSTVLRQSPENVGFQKYYYSQPTPSGSVDHNRLEDFFSELEGRWPAIVDRLRCRQCVNAAIEDIFAFIALQRARVPAARDACEAILAAQVKAVHRRLDAEGKLPPMPKAFEHLLKHIEVAIDPHQSIHAMVQIIQGMAKLVERIGISALHNATDVPFSTSDNPVIWFDPSVPTGQLRPYTITPTGPIALIFPVTPDIVLYGHTSMHEHFARDGLLYGVMSNREDVEWINELTCRFAYQAVFASTDGFADVVARHADLSPVVDTQIVPVEGGEMMLSRFVFGQRRQKPKWQKRDTPAEGQ